MKANQKGFSVVEILLVIVVIGLIGGAGWYVWQSKNKNNSEQSNTQTTEQTTKTTTETQKPDPYAGWKTYTSTVEGFSFKYPADWKLTNNLDPRDSLAKESVSLSGPNNFSLGFDVYKVNPNSDFECANCKFNGSTALDVKNYGKQLSMVVDSNVVNGQPYQTLSISEYKDRSQQPIHSWPYYTSKTQSGYVVRWSGDYVKAGAAGGELIYSSYEDFVKMAEVVTAKQVLESLSY